MGIVPDNNQLNYTNDTFIIDYGGSGQQSTGTFRMTADPDWDSVNGYAFELSWTL